MIAHKNLPKDEARMVLESDHDESNDGIVLQSRKQKQVN